MGVSKLDSYFRNDRPTCLDIESILKLLPKIIAKAIYQISEKDIKTELIFPKDSRTTLENFK